ncbi:protein phosphatase 1 regulatory subunit 36-like [Liolophura sinensis]|uniref:protein phosphatase 1 regulatory subunit 36-like n=1 Tax=Liolophura sinensis TaxID=3198878 RepID=UPI0031586AFB
MTGLHPVWLISLMVWDGCENRAKSPRPQIKQTSDHTTVILGDIKSVATDMLSEVERISSPFEGLYDTEQFDDFLLHLLSYFHCFFEKETLQNKPQDMYIEPSLSDKKAYAEACCKVEVALKLLGKSYCVLVLGLGLKFHHHMACGLSRVSSTHKDRSMYETFYSFCTFVVWIAFRRPDFEVVRKEIGRMLRSNTFNPAIRVKNAPEEPKPPPPPVEGQEEQVVELVQPVPEKKLTPAEYRRLHGKRPAIKSIINQRSPAIVSILPSPKEEAHWLFHKHHPAPPGTLRTDGDVDMSDEDILERLTIDKTTFKIGILGEPLGMFNPVTLSPVGAENEEEQGEDGSGDTQGDVGSGSNKTPTERVSRQQTAVSHATTEALDDE